MGGWAALWVLLLRLACEARPAASALELGYFGPKGPPYFDAIDDGPNTADLGVAWRADPDYPTISSPTLVIYLTLDNWWKEAVDETLVLPKGTPWEDTRGGPDTITPTAAGTGLSTLQWGRGP